MDTKTVNKLRGELQESQASGKTDVIIELLQTLKEEMTATEDLIRVTKIGLAVGKLRSHDNKQVSELSKEIVKKWKQDVTKKPKAAAPSAESTTTPAKPSEKPDQPRSGKTDGVDFEKLNDKTRDTCLSLLYNAMVFDSSAPSELVMERALSIESTVLDDNNGSTGEEYKKKVRSLMLNLKDKKNPSLREAVISGDTPAATFCRMSSADMASEERKQQDRALELSNLFKARGAGPQQAETDSFKCGRCKQRKCTYYQMQTRSADEPMTTFVTCTVCNNRWKFS
ncbi:transcription elongation factor [Wallemia mellicola]|nr:transcription elongation factor [Wallemia mellicola]